MQQRAAALAKAGHDGAIEVNLPVDSHQQLHRFHLRIVRSERSTRVNELITQILDRMAKSLQGVSRLGRNPSSARVTPCLQNVLERTAKRNRDPNGDRKRKRSGSRSRNQRT